LSLECIDQLLLIPESIGFVKLVLALTSIKQLISTLPAIVTLFSMLAKSG
jgi:hypothetical protein